LLLKKMDIMQNDYETHGSLSAIALTAPTGAGKTVIAATVVEGLFFGNDVYGGDSRATVLWLSDSPSLNDQTLKRFEDATDLLSGATAMETIGPEFAKSKGYVDYIKDHPDMFTRVLAVTDEKKDDIRYLVYSFRDCLLVLFIWYQNVRIQIINGILIVAHSCFKNFLNIS